MNYVGNDRNYEMPEDVLRMLFDEKANKRLKNHKILFSTEHSEIPYSLDQALEILNRFGEEFHHNTGCDRSLNVVKRRKTVKEGIREGADYLYITATGRLEELLNNIKIPRREAERLYSDSPDVIDDSTISGLLSKHYDSDTMVSIYYSTGASEIDAKVIPLKDCIRITLNRKEFESRIGHKLGGFSFFQKG